MKIFKLMDDKNETQKKDKKDMALTVKTSRCPQNHPCPSIRVCPVGALSQKGYAAPVVDMDKCIKCGKCVRFCPMRALALE
jgi:ferredoxin